MPDPVSFITFDNVKRLFKLLTGIRDARREELARIGDVFGDPIELARFYVEPKCQHHNPADRHEDLEPVSQVRAPAFGVVNDFLRGEFTPLGDGRSQMFVLSDAGMGKTSLLTMIRLTHLMAFWPRGYECLLLKLGEDTLERLAAEKDPARTVLLLDALDEDPLAWGDIEARLVALLDATKRFRRVILSCRTQFFPETGSDAFGRPGRVEVGGYTCPMMFLSLFDEDQVRAYLRKRFPDRWHQRLLARENPERQRAERVVLSMRSLRFRPLLLAHIRDILDAGERDWNAYGLYQALVNKWLDREERKLRDQLENPPEKETLWKVCTRIAVHLHERGSRLLGRDELDELVRGLPAVAALEHFDVGGRSLLNRNAVGAYRFSHYSIQEFLVVRRMLEEVGDSYRKVRVTGQMLEFLEGSVGTLDFGRLDLSGLQTEQLAAFGFRERLEEGGQAPLMQLILPGDFQMGSPASEGGAYYDERPQHRVTIGRTFALGRYPVTFEEFGSFARATGREEPDDNGWGRGRQPIINVSWEDAAAYCAWLSEQTGGIYRLPTEAEWEYAARAGTSTRWFFGDEEAELGAHAWYRENSDQRTHPVGGKRPNPWGLFEMYGNVWEWCGDWFGGYRKGEAADPVGPPDGAGRALRGGSWDSAAGGCRSAYRLSGRPGDRNLTLGFRCARVQS
jgi:formylglycine-generating enzyme required for sulfatase activity